MRKNKSRSKELELLKLIYTEDIEDCNQYLQDNPKGGKYVAKEIEFIYGNISRLLKDFSWDNQETITNPFGKEIIKSFYHLDGIKSKEKRKIEEKYNFSVGTLTKKSKADILIITENKKYIISYKDSSSVAKLGQVSKLTRYNNARLKGGFLYPYKDVENDILFTADNTGLETKKLNNLKSSKDKKLAFIKKNYPNYWKKYVKKNLNHAVNQLEKFGEIIKNDKGSLISFINLTIFGIETPPENFYLALGNKLISSKQINKFFKNEIYEINIEHYKTKNKFSLIIKIKYRNKDYYLTKIEPSFDGGNLGVSQTKGIIFYFQQYSKKNIWTLLNDIP